VAEVMEPDRVSELSGRRRGGQMLQIESWGAFAEGKNGFFTNPTLVGIADAHDKSVAQIALRWTIQRGVVVIPKSVRKERVTAEPGRLRLHPQR